MLRDEYKSMSARQFNPKEYLSDLDHLDMSESEKLAFIEALHGVMQGFAAQAWGHTPAQTIDQLCPPQNSKHQKVLLCSDTTDMPLDPPANDNEKCNNKETTEK